jgi:hypothetical protein
MTVPPYACAFVVSVISSIISDRYKARGFVTMSAGLCLTIGYAMFLGTLLVSATGDLNLILFYMKGTTNKHTRYGALFFQITGGYIGAPALCAWIAK